MARTTNPIPLIISSDDMIVTPMSVHLTASRIGASINSSAKHKMLTRKALIGVKCILGIIV